MCIRDRNKAKWPNELFVDDIINLLGDGVQAFSQWLQIRADSFTKYNYFINDSEHKDCYE